MIKLFQLLFFLLFINVNLPSNAVRFIYSFSKNILDYFPTFLPIGGNQKVSGAASREGTISQSTREERAYDSDRAFKQFCIPHIKFEENAQTCSAFINLGSFINQLLIFLIVKLVILSIVKIIEKNMSKEKEDDSGAERTKSKNINKNKEENLMREKIVRQSRRNTGRRNQINKNSKKSTFARAHLQNSNQNQDGVELTLKKDDRRQGRIFNPRPGQYHKRANRARNRSNREQRRQLSIFNQLHGQSQNIMTRDTKREKKKQEKSCLGRSLLQKINDFLSLAFFFKFIKAVQLRAVIGGMVSALSIHLDPWTVSGVLNLTLSTIVVVFYSMIIFLVIFLVRKRRKVTKKPSIEKNKTKTIADIYQRVAKNLELFDELKDINQKNPGLGRIAPLSMTQDLLIPVALTIFVDTPVAQILISIILLGISSYTIIRHSPFKTTQLNILQAGNRCVYLVILIVFLINHLTDKEISEEARFDYIGFGIIGLVSLLIGLNMGVSFWAIISAVKKKLCKGKKVAQDDQIVETGLKRGGVRPRGERPQQKIENSRFRGFSYFSTGRAILAERGNDQVEHQEGIDRCLEALGKCNRKMISSDAIDRHEQKYKRVRMGRRSRRIKFAGNRKLPAHLRDSQRMSGKEVKKQQGLEKFMYRRRSERSYLF